MFRIRLEDISYYQEGLYGILLPCIPASSLVGSRPTGGAMERAAEHMQLE